MKGTAGGFEGGTQEVVIPAGSSGTTTRSFPGIISAMSQIQQFYVIEQGGQEIPDDFLTIQGKLNFFKVGLGSGFMEGLTFAFLTALVLPILSDEKLMSWVAKYFPLAQSKLFLWTLALFPVIVTGGICCYLSKYRIGSLTRKAIDSLLMGRLVSLIAKAILIFAGLITLASVITRHSAWHAAQWMTLKNYSASLEAYRVIMNVKPQLVNTAYETIAVFTFAILMPFITIWGVSFVRKIKAKKADIFWKNV